MTSKRFYGADSKPKKANHHPDEGSLVKAVSMHFLFAALSRWENEGGATSDEPPCSHHDSNEYGVTTWPSAESMQLRMRVIALENLVIALLAQIPAKQMVLAHEIACHISPRCGYTQHPLTLRAADQMRSLIDRSVVFRFKTTE